MSGSDKTEKKLKRGIAAVVVLAACLCATTLALIYSAVSVDNNLFQTGTVKMNLNDGKPVIEEGELFLEPGMTVEKTFFIENNSTWDVYYRLYFDQIQGGLADVLNVSIRGEDGAVLYNGTASQLTRTKTEAARDVLKQNERQELTIVFSYPEHSSNSGQNQYLSFDLNADAVQTKNNPGRLFE